jgi:hypothetical protein
MPGRTKYITLLTKCETPLETNSTHQIANILNSWAYQIILPNQLFIHNVQLMTYLENATQDPLRYKK